MGRFQQYEVVTREDGAPYELGRGSMGIIYKAVDTKVNRPVALKVMHSHLLHDESARQDFVRRVTTAIRLRHPNVASIFQFNADNSSCFYAMEFVEGDTLELFIRKNGPLDPVLALKLAGQLCGALEALEKQHLVHRDIKPSNILLVQHHGELNVKLIDFGLLLTGGEANETGFQGTPLYASPEQIQQQDVDIRSDVYSLGATLWFMLTGQPPHTGSSPAEIARNKLCQPPRYEQLAHLPPALTGLLKKMLAVRHFDRPFPSPLRLNLESCLATLNRTAGIQRIPETTTPPPTSEHPFPLPGEIVAGRYRLISDLGERSAGRVYHAEDLKTGHSVCLNILRHRRSSDEAAAFEREIDHLKTIEHPNLLRVYELERLSTFDVLSVEWAGGIPLIDVLRARRSLRVDEVQILVREIAAAIDFAVANHLTHLLIGLRQILIRFPGRPNEKEAGQLLATPVTEWPSFDVKIYPLGAAVGLDEAATWTGDEPLIAISSAEQTGALQPPSPNENAAAHYTFLLGSLVYELLGGVPRRAGLGYVPLPSLSEEGNQIVKRCLSPNRTQHFPNTRAFADALAAIADVAHSQTHTQAALIREGALPSVPFAPRRRRLLWAGAIGAAVALGALAATFLVVRSRQIHQPQEAAHPTAVAVATPSATSSSPLSAPSAAPVPSQPKVAEQPRLQAATPSPSASVANESVAQTRTEPSPFAMSLPSARPLPPKPTAEERFQGAFREATARQNEPFAHLSALVSLAREFPEEPTARRTLEAAVEALNKTRDQAEIQRLYGPLSAALSIFEDDAKKGNAQSMIEAGRMLDRGMGSRRDLAAALKWFEAAAAQNEPEGLYVMSEAYLTGKGVVKDQKKGLDLLLAAASLNEPRAMDRLGVHYLKGIGVPVDYREAFRLFDQAQALGNLNALANLGVLYMNGQGVAMDRKKGAELFHKGALGGNVISMRLYAGCLENGVGVIKDLAEARKWYQAAAERGDLNALKWCKQNGIEVNRLGRRP